MEDVEAVLAPAADPSRIHTACVAVNRVPILPENCSKHGRMRPRNDGIWIIDDTARTVYANDRMAEILGISTSELAGAHSFDFIFSDDTEDAARLFNSKKAGSLEPFRFKLRRRDGSAVSVHVQGTPLKNAAGEFTGVVGTFTEMD
jgi:PAS domain S-box-containing protein